MRSALFLAALVFALTGPAAASPKRHPAVTRQFQHLHPCPSTGRKTGPCPGFVKDHVLPLCAGGPDRVDNMQWQALAEAKAKDREETALCRSLHAP
jgi:hypothetical protein